jgi:hypothetical protein
MPPLMPMTPPQNAKDGPAEHSDASGLVEGDDGQWFTTAPVDGPNAPTGAPPMLPAGEREQPEKSQAAELIEPEQLFAAPPPVEEAPPPVEEAPPPVEPGIEPPLLLPFAFPVGRPEERDKPQRSKAGEALEEDSPWMPEETVVPEDDDRVPVVRMTGADDDFASWDSEMLPWGGGETAEEPAESTAEWGSLQWQGEQADPEPEADIEPIEPGYAAWRPSKVTAEARIAEDRPLMSGGPDLTSEELEKLWAERDEETRQRELERRRAAGEVVDEDEPDEAEDDDDKDARQAVHLLHQDDRAWGGNAADTGVIG